MISKSAIVSVLKDSLKVKDNELLTIITDKNKLFIAKDFYNTAKELNIQTEIYEIPVAQRHGEEPPEDIALKILNCNVSIFITTFSLSHTKARRKASKKGVRIASMPGILPETINRCLDIDYDELKKICRKTADLIKENPKFEVRTDKGTYLTVSLGKNKLYGLHGATLDKPGNFGNLPDGEICFLPDNIEGVCIVDASVAGIGRLSEPITIEIKQGKAVSIRGKESEKLIKILDSVGPNAYKIAEFGIGTNKKAKIIGSILEDEKAMGTFHIAFGNDLSFGGDNNVPIHIDCVVSDASIKFDNQEMKLKDIAGK